MSDINNIRRPWGDNYKMEPPCMACTKAALCEYHEKQKRVEERFAKLMPIWQPQRDKWGDPMPGPATVPGVTDDAANPESPDGSDG